MNKDIVVTPLSEKFNLKKEEKQVYPVVLRIKVGEEAYIKSEVEYVVYQVNDDYREDYSFGVLEEYVNRLQEEEYSFILNEIRKEVSKELKSDLLIPFNEWICDCCGEVISEGEEACITFHYKVLEISGELLVSNLKIVHLIEDCELAIETTEEEIMGSSVIMPIEKSYECVGRLLSLSEEDNFENEEDFKEILKRLTIPYYEQSRFYIKEIEDKKYSIDSAVCKYDRDFLREFLLNKFRFVSKI